MVFEKDCIALLHENVAYLLREHDYKLGKKDNQRDLSQVIKTIAQKGFIRTHAFLVNWMSELFEMGELSSKSLHEICSVLPWSWDQSKKYCDALEESGLLIYSRDATGKKNCCLTLQDFFDNKFARISLQELRLFHYLKHQKKMPTSVLVDLKEATRNYYSKLAKYEEKRMKLEKEKKRILPANKQSIEQFAEKIASLYWHSKVGKKTGILKNIESLLMEEPSLVFSLKHKK